MTWNRMATDPFTTVFSDLDGRSLVVHVTGEGVILDAYAVDSDGNDFLLGTIGRTAGEWFEYVEGAMR